MKVFLLTILFISQISFGQQPESEAFWQEALNAPESFAPFPKYNFTEEKKGGLNFAVVGSAFKDLKKFKLDASTAVGNLMTHEPFKSNSDKISFVRLLKLSNFSCKHSAKMARLLTCDTRAIKKALVLAKIKHDKIIVIVNDSQYGGSGGGSVSTIYNGKASARMLAHEVGHSFGLRDEYTYGRTGKLDGKVYANCFAGKPPVKEWNGIADGYFKGCANTNWYRSTKTSLMKTLSGTFNRVSIAVIEAHMAKYISATPKPKPKPKIIRGSYELIEENGKLNINIPNIPCKL